MHTIIQNAHVFCLYCAVIPKEIARQGNDAIERYRRALRKGKKRKMPRCNLIVLGKERTGKTSLLRLVMGKKFDKDMESTRGIDNERVCVVDMKQICSLLWKEVKDHDEEFLKSIAEVMVEYIRSHKDSNTEAEKSGDCTSSHKGGAKEKDENKIDEISRYLDTVLQSILAQAPFSGRDESSIEQPVESAPDKQSSKAETTHSSSPKPNIEVLPPKTQHDNISKSIAAAAEPMSEVPTHHSSQTQPPTGETPADLDVTHMGRSFSYVLPIAGGDTKEVEPKLHFNALDFAGQVEYHPMHHCFIVRRALYLVVFNLQEFRKALKDADQGEKDALDEAFEEIGYWLHSIHAHVRPDPVRGRDEAERRIILVGTHKAPSGGKKISEEEMEKIHTSLDEKVQGCIKNDLCYVCPDPNDSKKKRIFAAVENSADGEEEQRESGALLVKSEILKAWDGLPFKNEVYPTSWLRFEAFLNSLRIENDPCVQQESKQSDVSLVQSSEFQTLKDLLFKDGRRDIIRLECVKEIAKKCHIGEEDEDEIELALVFFHETGTLVYMSKLYFYFTFCLPLTLFPCVSEQLPSLYLKKLEKEKLNNIILLDQRWLLRVMMFLMELSKGEGEIPTTVVEDLKDSGTTKSSTLRKCWKEVCSDDDSFYQLCLILQSFCLIFPVPHNDSQLAPCSEIPADTQCTVEQQKEVLLQDGDLFSKEDQTYLIPSMLPDCGSRTDDSAIYEVNFCFDFSGFLPVEVYHRLLCLMMRDQRVSRGKFTAKYFRVTQVHGQNWMVQRLDTKLNVFVTYK